MIALIPAISSVRRHAWRIMHGLKPSASVMTIPVYPAVFTLQEDRRYVVNFCDFSNASAAGDTLDQATQNAAIALTAHLEMLLASDEPIPTPSEDATATLVAPSARVQSAILFRWHLGEHRTSEVMRSLQTSWARVRDLQTAGRNITIDRADEAARALGYSLVLSYAPISSPD